MRNFYNGEIYIVEEEEWSGTLSDGSVFITNSLHSPPKVEEVKELLDRASE